MMGYKLFRAHYFPFGGALAARRVNSPIRSQIWRRLASLSSIRNGQQESRIAKEVDKEFKWKRNTVCD
jgi:hypothetical protein